jgi:23S rRNA pseudouridine1911/1915/1917 synthase
MEKDNLTPLTSLNSEILYEHFSFIADLGQNPLRVDKFLMFRVENATRTKIQQAAKNGSIKVNNVSVKSSYKVKAGDEVKVFFNRPPHENLLVAEKMNIEIIHEDEVLLVVNKPPGIVVHPGHGNYSGTLINGLLYHFSNLPMNSENRPGLVHRIDKDTSGLLVVAKTELSMVDLSKQFYNKTSKRKYIALVWGDVKDIKGSVVGSIGRHPKNRLQMEVFPDDSQGKKAVTHYRVLERFGYVTLIECELETGRTHQIRVHMKHIGHPIFNDERYGGDRVLKGTTFSKYKKFVENCFLIMPRQALHAKTLGFIHPVTKKEIQFDSIIPNDMAGLIDKWRSYALHKQFS